MTQLLSRLLLASAIAIAFVPSAALADSTNGNKTGFTTTTTTTQGGSTNTCNDNPGCTTTTTTQNGGGNNSSSTCDGPAGQCK